jgi:hypothetical protein
MTKNGATVPKDTKAIHTSEMDAKVLLLSHFIHFKKISIYDFLKFFCSAFSPGLAIYI